MIKKDNSIFFYKTEIQDQIFDLKHFVDFVNSAIYKDSLTTIIISDNRLQFMMDGLTYVDKMVERIDAYILDNYIDYVKYEKILN